MFKKIFFFIISMLLFSCNYPGEGSLGGWAYITFPMQKDKFKLAIDSLRNAHQENVVPERWQYDSEYWTRDTASALEGNVS